MVCLASSFTTIHDDDDMQEARPMRPAYVAAFDVRRSTGSRDEAGVAWRAGARRSPGIVLQMRQNGTRPERHDMMQGQEVEQDRRVGAGVKNQGAGFRDSPAGEASADGFVLRHRPSRFDAVPVQAEQFGSRL